MESRRPCDRGLLPLPCVPPLNAAGVPRCLSPTIHPESTPVLSVCPTNKDKGREPTGRTVPARTARPGPGAAVFSCHPLLHFDPSASSCWAKNNTQSRPTGPRGIVSFSCFGPSRPLSPTYKTAAGGRASPHSAVVASFEPRRTPEPTSRKGLRSSGPRVPYLHGDKIQDVPG